MIYLPVFAALPGKLYQTYTLTSHQPSIALYKLTQVKWDNNQSDSQGGRCLACLNEESTFMFMVTSYVHGCGIEVSFLASKESQSAS